MNPVDASLMAAIASGFATALAVLMSFLQLRVASKQHRTAVQMQELTQEQIEEAKTARRHAAIAAVMDRLAQINQLKIMRKDLWERLLDPVDRMNEKEDERRDEIIGLGHLIFATMKMYEEVYLLWQSNVLTEADFLPWKNRLQADFSRWERYAAWWNREMNSGFKDGWNAKFVEVVDSIVTQ